MEFSFETEKIKQKKARLSQGENHTFVLNAIIESCAKNVKPTPNAKQGFLKVADSSIANAANNPNRIRRICSHVLFIVPHLHCTERSSVQVFAFQTSHVIKTRSDFKKFREGTPVEVIEAGPMV